MTKTKIYGHRGCMGTYPENTLLGFQKAIEQGVDGLEIDVHMTKDGEIVVIHDEFLDRTTDGTGYIKDLTLEEIKKNSTGIKYSYFAEYDENTWVAERVPTLKEVLELLEPYDTELNIELKTCLFQYDGIEEKVLSIVEAFGNGREVIYSSFHLPSLLRLKTQDQTVKIAWLLERDLPQSEDYMQTFGLEALHVSKQVVLGKAYQWKEQSNNLRVWTVNDTDNIKQLLDMNVKAIITDFPDKALFYKSERKTFV